MNRCVLSAALVCLLAACGGGHGVAEFARWDADLRAAGKLRADRAPMDAPYGPDDIVESFARIGFGSEFEIVDGRYERLPPEDEAPLTRWGGPVRYALFGRHDADDRAALSGYAERLERATGLDIARR